MSSSNAAPSTTSSASVEPSNPQVREELNKLDSLLVYDSILSDIFYHGGDFDSWVRDDWLIYRKQTVSPKYIDKITGVEGISGDLITELKRVNEKPAVLLDEMGEKLVAKSISGEEELETLFVKARKKFPKTRGVINFSKIALSQDATQALVFVEYYSERRKLIGTYFLLPIVRVERVNESILRFNVANEKSRIIPVFADKLARQ